MATSAVREAAYVAVYALGAGQSQVSLTEQAGDCVAIVTALGYYDLADFLKQMSSD